MNQGRIWCVVHPTVGLPLLIGSVALTSVVVHTAILTHTNWMGGYWQGGSKAKAAMIDSASPASLAAVGTDPSFAITVTPVKGAEGDSQTAFVVTVGPKTAAAAPERVALATETQR